MKRLTIVVACLLLGACAQPQWRSAIAHSYRLQGSALRQPDPGVAPSVISVLPVDAAPGLDSQAMLYSPEPGQLLPYRDSGWLAPAPALVRTALADTLARQRWVAAVEQDAALAPAPWLLHCTLTRLEHDYARPPGIVRLGLRCELVRARRIDRRALAQRIAAASDRGRCCALRGGRAAAARPRAGAGAAADRRGAACGLTALEAYARAIRSSSAWP